MPSRAGQLLIASARLGDPNFSRTVVLLVQDDEEHGTLGLVLNRPTGTSVKEACADQLSIACAIEAPLFKGGPCEGVLTVLHGDSDSSDIEVTEGVHFTSRRESIESIMLKSDDASSPDSTNNPTPRFFVGYAGWAVGQLDNELEAGGWLLLPATPDHVFRSGADEEQWNKLITEVTLGKWVDPEKMPEDPTVN
jgi:putative transcriptional regulator